jgi:Arc-like DNA binding domain
VPRKESALLDYKLRIRESLRRRLAQSAERRGISMNAEMTRRLEESFDQERTRSLDDVAQKLNNVLLKAENLVAGAPVIGVASPPTVHPAPEVKKEEQK